ncbi:MAG TPA: hypothetical protein VIS52_04195 [Motiliproteus sp.]
MTPRPLPWMKPGDLILFDLEMLPWTAYLRMVETYFKVNAMALQPLREVGNRAEYLVLREGEPHALLHCMHLRKPVDINDLGRLTAAMCTHDVHRGYLFSPGTIGSAVYLCAGDYNVDLYSGNKLRVRIENLRVDQRRAVMDSITPTLNRSNRSCI